MGLMFPEDLRSWQRWQRRRHGLRALRHFGRPDRPSRLVLHTSAEDPVILFAAEATTPAAIASTLAPLHHLGDVPCAVLAPADISAHLPGTWHVRDLGIDRALPRELHGIRSTVGLGTYLPAGAAAYTWARTTHARFFVVQHGLLAPHMAPLPHDAHLLAFTDRDAEFWRSGRTDVTTDVVGSHLLWQAARHRVTTDRSTTPVFLGQLHGAELPRRISAATATRFCRQTGALYRPHPAETDRLSRAQHALWRREGIRFAPHGPVLDSPHPVVSIFSTGVLEAAAAGIPAWVTCVHPPGWLTEFWERYELSVWGHPPTPAPAVPESDPAIAIASRVLVAAKGAM